MKKTALIVFVAAMALSAETLIHNDIHVYAEDDNTLTVIGSEANENPENIIDDVSDLKVIYKSNSSVGISWDNVDGADGYNIYSFNNTTKEWEKIFTATELKYDFTNLKSGTKYTFAVKAFKENTESENYAQISVVTNIDKVKMKKVQTTLSEVSLSWNKVQNADGYIIEQYNYQSKTWDRVKKLSGTDYTLKKLSPTTSYKFYVRAYQKIDGEVFYGEPALVETTTKPAKIKSLTVSANSTSGYKLSWPKVAGATKYYVYRYDAKNNKYSLIADTKSNSVSITGRKPAQKDVYIIRTVKTFKGKTYKSEAYKKRVSSLPSEVSNLNVNVRRGTAEITWSKLNGVSGYQIYYKTVGSSEYKLLKEIKNSNTTKYTTNALAGKKVYIKVRAYVNADNKKYFGGFSKTVYKRIFKNLSYNQIINNYRNSYAITTSNSQGYKISDSKKANLLYQLTYLGGTESFALLDLDSGAMIGYNAKSYIETASTVKMPFMLYSLKCMDKGAADLNTKIRYTYQDANDGSGVIQYSPFGTEYTLASVFHNICKYSDNSGYYMLQRTFGIDGYNKYISSLGCRTSVSLYGNRWGYVSAADSAREWIQMYDYFKNGKYGSFIKKELKNSGYSNFRIGLQNKNYNVYSKCGFTSYLHHDTAVVEAEHPYVLICLTTTVDSQRLQNVARAADAIHDEMWRYYDSKK